MSVKALKRKTASAIGVSRSFGRVVCVNRKLTICTQDVQTENIQSSAFYGRAFLLCNNVFYNFCQIIISALNKSPSTVTLKVPPHCSTQLLAIASPSPLPSVVRDFSPRTNRSHISSAVKSILLREMFLTVTHTLPSALCAVM